MASDNAGVLSVFKAQNLTEAHFVKDLLLQEGIDATVTDEHEPLAGLSIVPPDVMIRREDEPHAREIVADYLRGRKATDSVPDWTCPNCKEQNPDSFAICFQCGTDRPGANQN